MKLLVIDDEQIIVQGLVDHLQGVEELDLDISSTSVVSEAVEWIHKIRFDIVLTDIQMPGMSGLELQKKIIDLWPQCKVIFLSGYNEFSFVQQAIRQGSADYILKVEGLDKIAHVIRRTVDQINAEMEREELFKNAERQLEQALPMLQKELFLEILSGTVSESEPLGRHFDELGLPFSTDLPVLLMLGRIDSTASRVFRSDETYRQLAINNILDDQIGERVHSFQVPFQNGKIVWFIQPKPAGLYEASLEEAWARIVRLIHGILDVVQATCRKVLKVELSIAAGRKPCSWQNVGSRLVELSRLLTFGIGLGPQLLLIENEEVVQEQRRISGMPGYLRFKTGVLRTLENALEDQDGETAHEALLQITHDKELSLMTQPLRRLVVFHGIANVFLAYFGKYGVPDIIADDIDLNRLANYNAHGSWSEIDDFFVQLIGTLMRLKNESSNPKEDYIVQAVGKTVRENLGRNISLLFISDRLNLNPSYLSRLYKKLTGIRVSEAIIEARLERSKQLLTQSDKKMNDIAAEIGFSSEPYFYRFFKRYTSMTPQEFRLSHKTLP